MPGCVKLTCFRPSTVANVAASATAVQKKGGIPRGLGLRSRQLPLFPLPSLQLSRFRSTHFVEEPEQLVSIGMWKRVIIIVEVLRSALRERLKLLAENLALRHQVMVLKRSVSRPKIRESDRLLWVLYSKFVVEWQDLVGFVQVRTVTQWRNPYTERLIGSIRRDCLKHVIVLGEEHLRSLLRS